jgi:hypothetical protein
MSQGPEIYILSTKLLAFCYHLAVILGRVLDALDKNSQRQFKLTTCIQILHKSQKDSVSDIKPKLKIRKLGYTPDSWEATNERTARWTRGRPHSSLPRADSREAMDLPCWPLDLRCRP